MKKKVGLILLLIILILTGAFYLTRQMAWNSIRFIIIWIGAIVVMHLVITPLVISIVRARDQRKAALEKAAAKHRSEGASEE
ncbi:hypothetical protein [Lentilactobacillus farraginis]|uniref:Uncharacterized protein n=1 Tax=Lentilactobacillus farraginis DSM 18382 = JCM 14108 TaxID=1423743 RepID=X0PEX8_9LACO|nr:hypothetical protein [Lentilactobacillus farraginis]KRM10143.1 hypothetical protein FD41_GL002329 [Lentilactobacillus farraginis DSM 18382 = JCM 14108]GAF35312.1 hypothetical protein JCM14108_191 [Lentilactobacillus farraginis DSM 18382 = JCM 14108]